MKKVRRNRKIWLAAGIASAVTGVLSMVGMPLFALNALFVPMGICILLLAHSFYGCPFYFIAFANTKVYERIVEAVEVEGLCDLKLIAQYSMIQEANIRPYVAKVISKGYLPGYMIGEDEVVRLGEKDENEKSSKDGKCEFCGMKTSSDENFCSSCGAPNKH